MTEATQRNWRELCAAVANENNPKKLEFLLKELIRALDAKQSQSQVGTPQTATTNR